MPFGKPINYYRLNKPTSFKEKLIAILFVLVVGGGIGFGGFYLMSLYDEYEKAEILKNPVSTMGVVSKKRSYKGKGMDVEYFVNKKPYTLSTGVSTETYNKYKFGDEIEVIYNKLDPSQAMLQIEFEKGELDGVEK